MAGATGQTRVRIVAQAQCSVGVAKALRVESLEGLRSMWQAQ